MLTCTVVLIWPLTRAEVEQRRWESLMWKSTSNMFLLVAEVRMEMFTQNSSKSVTLEREITKGNWCPSTKVAVRRHRRS